MIGNTKQKKVHIAILISNRLEFKAWNTTRNKEKHLTIIKRAAREVYIAILKLNSPKIIASKYL